MLMWQAHAQPIFVIAVMAVLTGYPVVAGIHDGVVAGFGLAVPVEKEEL